jgi:hypothetical protein
MLEGTNVALKKVPLIYARKINAKYEVLLLVYNFRIL